METTCQASYPLNSENASPPGTFKAYLSWADMALPPEALTSAVTIAIVRRRWLFMTSSSFVKLGTRRYTCRSIMPARRFARCRNETMPRERPARRMLEACWLANPRPRTRSYGYGGADLLHGRHGARAPRRRQPVRNGALGAAGDARPPHVATNCSRAVARCPQGVPPGLSRVAGGRPRGPPCPGQRPAVRAPA